MATVETKSEFAARIGKLPSAVSNYISRGKLTGLALTADGRINVEEALQQLGANVDPGRGNPAHLFAAAGDAAVLPQQPELPVAPAAAAHKPVDPVAAALGDIRLRRAQLDLDDAERKAAVDRDELIPAVEARRQWTAQLEDLIASMEMFVLDLPTKLGLDRDGALAVREEWRRFRERQADQAAAAEEARAA